MWNRNNSVAEVSLVLKELFISGRKSQFLSVWDKDVDMWPFKAKALTEKINAKNNFVVIILMP